MPGPVGAGNLYSGALSEVDAQVARMRALAGGAAPAARGFNLGAVGNLVKPLSGFARFGGALLEVPAAVYQAKKVFNPNDNIVTSLQALGAGVGNLLQNKPYLSGARTLYNNAGQRTQVSNLPADYRGDELRLAAAARAAAGSSAGGGLGGGNAASFVPYAGSSTFTPAGGTREDRAYREAAISTAQQAASNPLFQKYQVADLTKQYNEAKSPQDRQRIGLEIWAQTNPQLASKLKAGQVGYAEAQAAPGMSNAGAAITPLPMPSFNFKADVQVATPQTMQQTFGSFVPGAGMVLKTPMFTSDPQATYGNAYAGVDNSLLTNAINQDPRVTNLSQDQRRALIMQYNQGLINKPFPPAAK